MSNTDLAAKVAAGDRRALAKAITLVESTRPKDRFAAEALLGALRKTGRTSLRIGLTGTPGVGKSTFIERFGRFLTAAGKRVAVLAVDPSSARTGGSILGDKTRMPELARDRNAFVRPSASRAALGGVADATRSAVALCEGAGFDVILVETVGVGQSETTVADMTDIFVLLLAPAGGDELQGVKRGIMEMADLLIVNKADGALAETARRTVAEYSNALRLMRPPEGLPEGFPKVLPVSAEEGTGIDTVWDALSAIEAEQVRTGYFTSRRQRQARRAFEAAIAEELETAMASDPVAANLRGAMAEAVASGEQSPRNAARALIHAWRGKG